MWALKKEGISLALAADALRDHPRLALSGMRCTRGAAQSSPDAAIDSRTIAVCRRSLSKALMQLHKRDGSTSTYRQRASLQLHLKPASRTRLGSIYLIISCPLTRRATQTGSSWEVTQQTVIFSNPPPPKKKHLPGVLICRNCSFKKSFGGIIKLLPLKQQELTMT